LLPIWQWHLRRFRSYHVDTHTHTHTHTYTHSQTDTSENIPSVATLRCHCTDVRRQNYTRVHVTRHVRPARTSISECGSFRTHHTVTRYQWEREKLLLSPNPHPVTDSHQITWLRPPHSATFVNIAQGVTSPHIAKVSVTTQFLSRVSVVTRDIAILSVCLSKKVILLLQQSTFRRFAAKYYHLFLLKVIFAVLEVSFWALTTVAKLLWMFLTLIMIRRLRNLVNNNKVN